jgi:hypothetical protein
MSGIVEQFVDFSVNTNNDTGENSPTSMQPIVDGNPVNAANFGRPDESLRQRTEAIKNAMGDTLYLRDADRGLIIGGPGLVTWPGSTTVSASGVPTLSDVLYILPMLTPGYAQTSPVPPVASAYGTLSLKRASDSMNSILVTSQRRSYAAGDQISIDVTSGASFSVTLDGVTPPPTITGYQRTIHIVSTGSDTLGAVISALNALTPSAPDNTQLVTAALEGGALNTDLLLVPQTKQFVSGNYDGEGHTVTPANLAAFFSGNPSSALAEGDTLCVWFPMVADTASVGGRRQAIPENSNTAIPVGAFFNSRVDPEKLVNALPICKVVNGTLVFATGAEVHAGETNASLGGFNLLSPFVRNGDFVHGVTSGSTRFAVSDWEDRSDLAVNGSMQLTATSPIANAKCLAFVTTSVSAATGRIEQEQELEVTPGQLIQVTILIKQLIAPTAGTYTVNLYWGDLNSTALSSSTIALQALTSVDTSPRTINQTITVPVNARFLKLITVEAAGITGASFGTAALFAGLQAWLVNPTITTIPAIDNVRMKPVTVDAVVVEDPNSYSLGQLAALLHFNRTTPVDEGTLYVERKDQTYSGSSLPPEFAPLGRIGQVGSQLLATATDALKARVSTPFSSSFITLVHEALPASGSLPGYRLYQTPIGALFMTYNARFDGANWNKDATGYPALLWIMNAGVAGTLTFEQWGVISDTPWSTWIQISAMALPQVTTTGNQEFAPLLQLFDAGGNKRTAFDHVGFGGGRVSELREEWFDAPSTLSGATTVVRNWTYTTGDTSTGQIERAIFSSASYYGLKFLQNTPATCFPLGLTSTTLFSVNSSTYLGANLVMATEWEADASGIGVNPSMYYWLGLSEPSLGPSVSVGGVLGYGVGTLMFFASSALTNWQFVTVGSSAGTPTDTGVALSAGIARFRMEYYGANAPGGARILAYVNGALIADISSGTFIPQDGPIGFNMGLTAGNAQTNPATCYLSPIALRFKRVLSDDAL